MTERRKTAEAKFFEPGEFPDEIYCALRDKPHCERWRAFCISLWDRYAPYADRHFLNEIRRQFQPRFWEMYLAVTFVERGFKLHRHPGAGAGPDFGIDLDGKRFWFDAIAATAGEGVDAVPQLELEYGRPVASRVPQEKIILRMTSALAEKRAKWKKDLEAGRVSANDGFIVAINDRAIRWAHLGAEMPYIVKGLYGFGNLTVAIDRRTLETLDTRHGHRPSIAKASGTEISSQPFAGRECPEVSAILYSSVDAANYPARLGDEFMILYNLKPNVPLPLGALRFYREYWVDQDELKTKDWCEVS